MGKLLTPDDLRHVTELLILQPTAFCNIDCAYCYLPERNDRHIMSIDLAVEAVRFVIREGLAASDLTVVWHSGEPLVAGPDWYRKVFAAMGGESIEGYQIRHSIQTNGTLIDERWCALFLAHGVQVGVSLDGPARLHDKNRKTRAGGGTHSKTMAGIDHLQRRGVPFHVICVVGRATLCAADELMDFFIAAGVRTIAFNVEEIEGPHQESSLNYPDVEPDFTAFFSRVLERAQSAHEPISIRERENLLQLLRSSQFGLLTNNTQNRPLGIVTVSSRGEVFTFSPELAGLTDTRYGNFSVGKLPGLTLASIIQSPVFQSMWSDIEEGVEGCRARCAYFPACHGGAPVNKLCETGNFRSGETLFCRLTQQCVADVVLGDLERRLPIAGKKAATDSNSELSAAGEDFPL